MARLEVDGLDESIRFHERLEHLPGSILTEMLDAGGDVLIKAHRAAAPKNTGKMANSIKGDKVKITRDGGYKDIYPKGTHHISHKSRYRNGGSGSRTTTNAEVGFIHEFGAPGRNIPAQQWMRKANEESADDVADAEQKVLDDKIDTL